MALFEIKNLTFTYPGEEKPALSNLNFSIEQGEFILICGKSGCGKTTLMRHFKTVLTPYGKREGELLFNGEKLEEISERKQAGGIGYVMQNPDNQLVTDKVWHELAFGLENLGYKQEVIRLRVAEMASYFGIQNWFYRNVEELSGGQKQILNLAAIMAMQPEVLVLDEPTSQLDPIAASDFLDTVRKINTDLGTTIIITEHRLEEVFPMADRVLVLENGEKLLYDKPQKVGPNLAGNDMFLAMPAPVQIYNSTGKMGSCPLNVGQGRSWMLANKQAFLEGKYSLLRSVKVPEKASESSKKEIAIRAKELWFRYEKNAPDVVKGLTFEVRKGELFCILGGNGTGKSTSLSLISGIRKPYRGKVTIFGKDIRRIHDKEKFGGLLGVLPQNPQSLFVSDTVMEELLEMKADKELMEQVIDETEIRHLLKAHPYDLSGGEQQRAALAKVLLLKPQILLLDEPTKGLDGFYKNRLAHIFEALKERGITILMVSHDIEFCASYGDTCALFFDGGIVTQQRARDFFTGNSFYTTAVNRMVRQVLPEAVTVKDVVDVWERNREAAEIPE